MARISIIRQLANLMAQLHAIQFDKIGALHFETTTTVPSGVIAMVQHKVHAHTSYSTRRNAPRGTLQGPFQSTKAYLLAWLGHEEDEDGVMKTPWALAVMLISHCFHSGLSE
jgi:hypothetical protein